MELFKKYFGLGTTLIIFDEEVNDIMKILKSFKDSGLLIKRIRKTIKNEEKEQKKRFLGMLLGTSDANLLENVLEGKIS